METEFLNGNNQILLLNQIKVSRLLGFVPNAKFESYGFADASKIAYAACVYLKIISSDKVVIRLIQAKSKVAPLKPLLTDSNFKVFSTFLTNLANNKVAFNSNFGIVNKGFKGATLDLA